MDMISIQGMVIKKNLFQTQPQVPTVPRHSFDSNLPLPLRLPCLSWGCEATGKGDQSFQRALQFLFELNSRKMQINNRGWGVLRYFQIDSSIL